MPVKLMPPKRPAQSRRVVGDDDLVGGQRHSDAAWKDDERARRPIANDRELREEVWLATEHGVGRELDQQGDVVHGASGDP